jgi:hypothetical protein
MNAERKLLVVAASDKPGYLTFLAVDGLTYVKHEKSLDEMIEFCGAVQGAIIQALEKLGNPEATETVRTLFESQQLPGNVVPLRKGA